MGKRHGGVGLRENAGFTLVELILVVGIIGVLASVALPNYRNFQARARQSEARLHLAALYTAQTSFFYEQESYTTCIDATTYPRSTSEKLYYAVGFTATDTNCGTGASDCHSINYEPVMPCPAGAFPAGAFYAANLGHGGAPVNDMDFASAITTSVSKSTFTLGAVGRISGRTGAGFDVWTINQTKLLVNAQSGL